MTNKTVIIICGQTASGKTALSLQLAKHFNTEIISADSRQCFKELNIGVAKPSHQELASVKHYFINSHSVTENVNAGIFEKYALKAAEEIFAKNDIAVMVGGTGLYIKAFCEGLDVVPSTDPKVRELLISKYKEHGIQWLQLELGQDINSLNNSDKQNPQRLMRKLEIKYNDYSGAVSFVNKEKRDFKILKIAPEISKEQLTANIDHRTEEMIKEGLVDEVRAVKKYQELNALQTVGYKEIFDFLEEKISLEKAISRIKLNTLHYAKRQKTWFKKDRKIIWLNTGLFRLKDIENKIEEMYK